MSGRVSDFINENWDKCVRYEPEDRDTFIGLPYPYIVPTCSGKFQEMYYWDTYFACEGLIISGKTDLAKNCADDMAFLINKFGFVPNGSRTTYLSRSQPPYFCMLVRSVFDQTKDMNWLKEMYAAAEKEYGFWQRERMTGTGLNRYGCAKLGEKETKDVCDYIQRRFSNGIDEKIYKDKTDFAENIIAECESGWDFNPRFSLKCKNYIPVDLNSNLYKYEKNMASFSRFLKNGREDEWEEKSEKRKELMNKYLWNGEYFADYDTENERKGSLFSAAAFHPLWAGAAAGEQAKSVFSHLYKTELEYGVAACEKTAAALNFQWAYPNAWAPLQFITVFGLDAYGFKDAALRIAKKYVSSVERIFETTGNLWEKYNASDGTINVVNEYDMPPMLGWTAGVYLVCEKFISENF